MSWGAQGVSGDPLGELRLPMGEWGEPWVMRALV